MALVEEIKQMRARGLTETQIRDNLKVRGISDKAAYDALSQSQIKQAVEQGEPRFPISREQNNQQGMMDSEVESENQGEMEKSILLPSDNNSSEAGEQDSQFQRRRQGMPQYNPQYPSQSQQYETTPPVSSASQNPTVQEYAPEQQASGYQDYQPYQSYTAGPSPDLITEISEQIISEKLSVIRKALEKTIDIRNTLGTKIDYIDERLKRIEKIIDSLQSSILRKVGDYVNDVQDIKKEMIETQKSLSKVFPEIKRTESGDGHEHQPKKFHKK